MLAGRHGEAVRRALQYQIDVGRFWGASRFVPVTNVHMMGDIEVMGDAGLEYLREEVRLGARCRGSATTNARRRSEEHTSELQSRRDLVCRLLLEKKKKKTNNFS